MALPQWRQRQVKKSSDPWVGVGGGQKMNVVMETAEEQTIQDFMNFQNYGSYLW